MILELKTSPIKKILVINDRDILSVNGNEGDESCQIITFYGLQIDLNEPFDKMRQIFLDAQSRDRFTDRPYNKTEYKSGDVIEVGQYKFFLETIGQDFEDGKKHSLRVYANFPTNNEVIKAQVEKIRGVERYGYMNLSKYDTYISTANEKVFDWDELEKEVSDTIKKCLEDYYTNPNTDDTMFGKFAGK